jgi:hypothetical protein
MKERERPLSVESPQLDVRDHEVPAPLVQRVEERVLRLDPRAVEPKACPRELEGEELRIVLVVLDQEQTQGLGHRSSFISLDGARARGQRGAALGTFEGGPKLAAFGREKPSNPDLDGDHVASDDASSVRALARASKRYDPRRGVRAELPVRDESRRRSVFWARELPSGFGPAHRFERAPLERLGRR